MPKKHKELIHKYTNAKKQNDLENAQHTINEAVNSLELEDLSRFLIGCFFFDKGFMLMHRQMCQSSNYWQGDELDNKTIAISSKMGIRYLFFSLRYLSYICAFEPKKIILIIPQKYYDFFYNNMPKIYHISYDENIQCDYKLDVLSLFYTFRAKKELVKTPNYLFVQNTKEKNIICICANKLDNINKNIKHYSNVELSYALLLSEKYQIFITDNSDIAHLCGARNIYCIFIKDINIDNFEWGFEEHQIYKSVVTINDTNKINTLIEAFAPKKFVLEEIPTKKVKTIYDKCKEDFKEAKELYEKGDMKSSFDICNELLEHFSYSYDVNDLYANIYMKKNDFEKALYYLQKAIKNNPTHTKSFATMASILLHQKKHQEAIECYKRILQYDNKNIETYSNIAQIYIDLKDMQNAMLTYEKCLQNCQCDTHEYIYYNIGVFYQNIDTQKAMYYFQKDIDCHKDNAISFNNLGNCYNKLLEHSLAISSFQKALQKNKYDDKVYCNLGMNLRQIGQTSQALQIYKDGFGLKKDSIIYISWNMSIAYLTLGDFENGWNHYESRLLKDEFQIYYKYLTKDKMLSVEYIENNHIVIFYEQGFGDNIQFVRYLDLLKRYSPSQITMVIQEELLNLFKCSFDYCNFITPNQEIPPHDYHCAIMSLPYILNTTPQTLPKKIPYIKTNKKHSFKFEQNITNIALVWKTSDTALDKEYRNIDLSVFEPLSKLESVKLFSMQVGAYSNEINDVAFNITPLDGFINDFEDSASILQDMDLVICIDTAIAHLSGAINKPCLMIVHNTYSWRWLLDRDDTIWYESVRLVKSDNENNYINTISNIIQNKTYLSFTKETNNINNINLEQPSIQEKLIDQIQQTHQLYNEEKIQEAKHIALGVYLKDNSLALNMLCNIYTSLYKQTQQDAYWKMAVLFLQENIKSNRSYDNLFNLALLYKDKKEYTFACAIVLQEALSKQYDFEAVEILKNSLISIKRYDEALILLKKQELNTSIYEQIAQIYELKKQDNKAIKYFQLANNISANTTNTFSLANIYKKQEKYKLAIEHCKQTLILQKTHISAKLMLGVCYKMLNQIEKSKQIYIQLCKEKNVDISSYHNLAFLYLLQGDMKNGFLLYEKRLEFPALKNIRAKFDKNKEYNNQNLTNKTLLVHYEQGFGDTIQFAIYLKLLKEKLQIKHIIVYIQEELLSLFKTSFEDMQIISCESKKEDFPHYDYFIAIMSLPLLLKLNINDIIKYRHTYIKTDKKISLKTKKLKIAIAYRSNVQSDSHEERSANLSDFQCLFDIDNIQLYSIQMGDGVSQIYHQKLENTCIDMSKQIKDFSDSASIVKCMDLVISIDTVIAHLAGSMGIKCFTLVPYNPNWRWLITSNQAIWYDSVSIFKKNDKQNFKDIIQTKILPLVRSISSNE